MIVFFRNRSKRAAIAASGRPISLRACLAESIRGFL
jgi:hypothetical protein